MTTAKKPGPKKAATKKAFGQTATTPAKKATTPAKKATTPAKTATTPPMKAVGGMPAKGKDPRGGLTAAGRQYFKEKEGLELRPGVKGPADTPEKMKRKGSFLRRHYVTPRGPVVDEAGTPTRQALQAAAWGEPVPKNEGDEKKLAEKGAKLLEQYHEVKGDRAKKPSRKRVSKKS